MASVGRNQPCPCGSGRRYKECHGALRVPHGDSQRMARSGTPDRERRMFAALDAQQAGRIAEADRFYQSVLDEEPGNFDALHMLGIVKYELGDLTRAEELVTQAISVNPHVPAARENLRLIFGRQRWQRAVEQLEREVDAARKSFPLDTPATTSSDVRVIAFYLPQYHPIPENDRWWGEGFTEWTNVRRASANFIGHEQPREPGELGYYDLRSPAVRERQAALAREFGIHGFCYYAYWFNGKRLLELPLEAVVTSGKPDLPFCICWANENWTRRWDGLDRDILIRQNYSTDDSRAFIRHFLPVLADRRYIRVDGRPLLLVYKLGLIPHARQMAEIWRAEAKRFGLGDLYLCAASTTFFSDPAAFGFDACVDFPPHRFHAYRLNAQLLMTNPEFRGVVFDYRDQIAQSLDATQRDYPVFRCVMPGWDNTARRQRDGTVFLNSSPDLFQYWLHTVVEQTRRRLPQDHRLVFVNAWNEWGEGCYLEPDLQYGRAYLAAVHKALAQPTRDWPEVVPLDLKREPIAVLASCESDPGLTVRRFGWVGESCSKERLVSVVMPVYNHAAFVREAVCSVLEQTYADIELIVVDDGSTDDSFTILTQLLEAAPCPVVLIRQPGMGASSAINRGLSLARGQYVAILNSDDAFAPTRLASLLAALERERGVLAFSAVEFVGPNGASAADHPVAVELQAKIDSIAEHPDPLHALLQSNVTISTGNLVFVRSLLSVTGGFRELKLCHDWDFVLAASYAGRLVFVSEPLYRYRLHGANTSSQMGLRATEESEAVYRRFFSRIDAHPQLTDPSDRERFLRFAHEHGCRGYFPVPATWRYHDYSEWVALYATLGTSQRLELHRQVKDLPRRPLLSVLLTTYDSDETLLRRCLDSVRRQIYPEWELCVADDASSVPAVRTILEEYRMLDSRIKVSYRSETGHISRATNSALALATGEYIVLLDHDDELAEDALYWLTREIIDHPAAVLIYSDEDKIDESGVRFDPYFKPDWNPELMRAQNCVSHLGAIRATDLRELGGFRVGVEGAQDWDVALRISERYGPGRIRHIPRVLYHWRTAANSTAAGMERKPYARVAQRRVVSDHLARTGRESTIEPTVNGIFWRVDYEPRPEHSATVVVDGRGSSESLRETLASVGQTWSARITSLRVLVDNADEARIACPPGCLSEAEFHVLRCAKGVSLGAAWDLACRGVTEDVIILLLAGVTELSERWCERLIGYAQDPETGVVAPALVARDGTFHNAGILLDPEQATVRAFLGKSKGAWSSGAREALAQNFTVPGSECFAFRRHVHAAVGGFGETFMDIDLLAADYCLRVRSSGLLNVWTPYVEGIWTGRRASRWAIRDRGEIAAFLSHWQDWVAADPAYNPNLAAGGRPFELAFPPRPHPTGSTFRPWAEGMDTAIHDHA